ncbi:GNAT family N-acetyltransferase [Geobacter sp. OR-1]|uniref:GNAT family N-acetyltransferase n=1 Tax=Geobacter sp. OR-1 TaxID=1266765 RepID=UPI001269B568|nr:GNAT family N-acetyltransferase [Geobacter sp. OR-1]
MDAWRVLADGTPMRSPEWLLIWWKYYAAPEDELSVLLFHEQGGTLVGLTPLYIRVQGKRRTVCLLGSGEASTNHTTWLAADKCEEVVSHAVAQFILDIKHEWNAVHFDSVDADDININSTVACMADMGFPVLRRSLHNRWEIELPPTWEEYLMILSKSHRKQCRSLQQRYLESGRVSVHKVSGIEDFHKGFEILLQLHSARWSEPAKPQGCFSDQRFREFHETVALELCKRNQLLLVWLEYDGKPISVEYQFMSRKSVYSYLAGMDPSITEFSPGNLSILASIQLAILNGCKTFDFSRGDQPYKAHWRAAPVSCHEVRIWPNNLSGRLEHAAYGMSNLTELGRMRAVKWIKSMVSPHFIKAWRQVHYTVTGKRRGPRRVGSSD